MQEKRTCFVIMGFGEKVDFETGRKLNLDATYRSLIKPAVEEAGFECTRADEIAHSGVIDVPMYERILKADLVVADVSTANATAFYELGVRHALRPRFTIIISEDQFKFPFDIGPHAIIKYKHLGEDLGVSEVRRVSAQLKEMIGKVYEQESHAGDSPVYTFLENLRPPVLPEVLSEAAKPATTAAPDEGDTATKSVLMGQVAEAKKRSDFLTAKKLLSAVREMTKGKSTDTPEDPYIIQQLALVTYKSKQPTPRAALEEARELLLTLDPATSNDTETLGLWGAVHKRLWDLTQNRANLDEAVRGYERGFYLRNDYYNGINLAYLLNVRAANAASRAEAVADFVEAARVRREVLSICEEELAEGGLSGESRYWVLATMAEAYLGMGDEAKAEETFQEAATVASEGWMRESTKEQMDKLRSLLADSPLKYVIPA